MRRCGDNSGKERAAALGGCLTAALLVVLPGALRANVISSPGDSATSRAAAGLEALHAGEYREAERLLSACIAADPHDALAPLWRLKLWWWEILEGRGEHEERLQADFELVRARAEARLRQDPNDVRALFALGEAHCTLGRLQGLRGQGWAALQSHRSGVPRLERALALEPELVPALASLGVYHYYAARAPGFLRFLGRFFSVQGDRERGLQELWRAATTPGPQQAEATFFLVEVLHKSEDDAIEALAPALALHQQYPRRLPFAVMLASVHLALERPDLALRVLEPLAASSQRTALGARFFVARTLCLSGRFAPALEKLDAFSAAEIDSVRWLAGWHAYYRGLALLQLGDAAAARAAFGRARAAPDIADSRHYAERALASRGDPVLRCVRAVEASLAWDDSLAEAAAALRPLLTAAEPGSEAWRRGSYALGVLTLRLGDPAAAVELLQPLAAEHDADEAWLQVRPRLRLLQALHCSGRHEQARDLAMRLVPELGNWGNNRQLELLVQACLQPAASDSLCAPAVAERPGQRRITFRFKDIGCVQVDLEIGEGDTVRRHEMHWRGSFWELTLPLAAGEHRYRFLLEGIQPLLDGAALVHVERADGPWSLVRVVGVTDSTGTH